MTPKLVKAFEVRAQVDEPTFIGQGSTAGRRQLIHCPSGVCVGFALPFDGELLGDTVDSQVVRPNGRADLSARYGVRLKDGRSFYVQNDGIRTVPPEYIETVLSGGFAPAEAYYCVTHPSFEIYDESLSILEDRLFITVGTRTPDAIVLEYYMVELE